MKAHRRKGIPTLMLQQGGAPSTEAERIARQIGPYAKRALKPTADYLLDVGNLASKASRYVFDPYVDLAKGLAKKEFEREKRLRASFEEQEMNRRANALRDIRRGIPGLLTPSDPGQLKTAREIAKKVAPFPSMQDYRNAARSPSYEESITDALNSASRAEANSQLPPNFLEPIKQEAARLEALRGPFSKQAMSVQDELMKSALESSQAKRSNLAKAQAQAKTQTQRAADALSGGVLRPPTTPVEKAEAAQAEQSAETAEASQAAASVSSPEEEALRQATGAPSSAEEAAAAAKPGDLSQGPSLVQGKDGTTIASIMGSADAQVDEKERLNELKTTFGLNLSDMEKAAPGIAFSLSLMGAQRAPGESVFNALARSAGSAGEGALKAKLALDAKERAIDSSLVSTVLNEKKVAEDYARNKTWVAVWDGGFDKNGVATASFYRMNQRQQDEASAAGIPIVPTGFLGDAMTAFGARAKAGAKLGLDLSKQIAKLNEPKSVDLTLSTSTKPVKGRRLFGRNRQGQTMEVVIPDDVAGTAGSLNTQIKDTAETMGLVGELRGLIKPSTGAFNVGAAAFGKTKAFFNLGKNATSEDFYNKALEEGNVALNNLTGYAAGSVSVDNAYNEMGADGVRELLKLGSELSDDDVKKKLQEHMGNVRGRSKKVERIAGERPDAYTSRVRFRAIQNALAAQLAPILLGESGRTISDADRVRVITLLGGFSDFSKAGILTTEAEMTQSVNMLESILGKYNEAALNDANRVLDAYTEASNYESIVQPGQRLYAPSVTAQNAMAELGKSYYTSRPKTNSASAPASTPVAASSIAPAK